MILWPSPRYLFGPLHRNRCRIFPVRRVAAAQDLQRHGGGYPLSLNHFTTDIPAVLLMCINRKLKSSPVAGSGCMLTVILSFLFLPRVLKIFHRKLLHRTFLLAFCARCSPYFCIFRYHNRPGFLLSFLLSPQHLQSR